MLCITSFYFLAEYLHLVGHATNLSLERILKCRLIVARGRSGVSGNCRYPGAHKQGTFFVRRELKKIILYLIITLNLIGNNKRFTLQRQTPCADPTFTPSYPTTLTTHLHTERITQVPSKNRATVRWQASPHRVYLLKTSFVSCDELLSNWPLVHFHTKSLRAEVVAMEIHREQFSSIFSGCAVWHVLGGVNTEGSLMPSCTSKNRVDRTTV